MLERELAIFSAAKKIYLTRHCTLHEAADDAWRLWCGVIQLTKGTEQFYKAVEELPLSRRTQLALNNKGIKSVRELIGLTPDEILRVRNIGRKGLREIEAVLSTDGMKLRGEQ